MRRFDPADQRTHRQGRGLHPDAGQRSAARRGERSSASAPAIASSSAPTPPAIRSTRRSATGGGWPAWSIGCRCSRRSWRPCSTISATMTSSSAMSNTDGALEARHEAIEDYFANREQAMVAEPGSYRPLAPVGALPGEQGMDAARSRSGRSTSPRPFPQPESDKVIDFGVDGPRDFAPERAQKANVYEAVAAACRQAPEGQEEGRAGELHDRRARAPRRAARGSWPQEPEAGRQLAGSAGRQGPTRR